MAKQVILRFQKLPLTVKGTSVINADGSYTVLINKNLNSEQQITAFHHELAHIDRDDFYLDETIEEIEAKNHFIYDPDKFDVFYRASEKLSSEELNLLKNIAIINFEKNDRNEKNIRNKIICKNSKREV